MENKSRNTPCENCREQRRKCRKLAEESSCERCQRSNVKCIFKQIEKPKIIYKRMAPLPKRIKLISSVENLDDQLEKLELEIAELSLLQKQQQQQQQKTNKDTCQCKDTVPCSHMKLISRDQQQWTYSITCKQQQRHSITVQVQASIRSFSDLAQFLNETMQSFYNQLHASPTSSSLPSTSPSALSSPSSSSSSSSTSSSTWSFFSTHQDSHSAGQVDSPYPTHTATATQTPKSSLTLTFRTFKDQAVFFRLLKMDRPPAHYQAELDKNVLSFDHPAYLRAKLEMIHIYFNCYGLLHPILVHSYYYPYLLNNPDSLLATSIVAAVTLSSCQHPSAIIGHDGIELTQRQISETARQQTRELLNDVLFNQDDDNEDDIVNNLEVCVALFQMGVYEIHRLSTGQARVYSNLCWRMLQELKHVYLKILRNPTKYTPIERIKAETWKRLYYFELYVEANLSNIYGAPIEFLHNDHELVFPSLLDCERKNRRLETSVICSHYLTKLFALTSKHDSIWFKLVTGTISNVNPALVMELEHGLFNVWCEIPTHLRIGHGPCLEYITPFTRAAWTDPSVLRLNEMYYLIYLSIQTRFMMMTQQGGNRALMMVSVCSDTLVKLFYYMNEHCPCTIDTHWTTLVMEVLDLLSCHADVDIRQRAKLNRNILKKVVSDLLGHVPCAPFFEISHSELCILYNNKKIE